MEHNQSTKLMLEALDKSENLIKKVGDQLVQAALERGTDKDNISSVGGAVSMTFAHMIADICDIPESKVFTMAATPVIAVVAAPYIRELLANVEVDEIEKSELGGGITVSTENKKPENILAALEQNKDSLAIFVKESWERSKTRDTTIAEHFNAFHLSMMMLIRRREGMVFNFSLSILAEHLLPLLTDEEKEALRNESVEP